MILTNIQKQKIKEIGQKYSLILVLAFGSQMKGRANRANKESDLDIAILDSKPETYKRFGDLYLAFSNVFPGYNADLRFLKDSEPVFLYQVFKNSQLFYGDPQVYFRYKAFAYKNYIDSKSLFNLKSKIIEKKQKELREMVKTIK